jgi:hypothetical protein
MTDTDTNTTPKIVGIGALAREQKLQAAREGLDAFKRSDEIDPDTDTDSIDVPAWVDEFTTTLDDAKAIAEKMRLEVTLRFGKQVIAGGDLRKQPYTGVRSMPLTQRQWTARSRARALATQEDDVRAYMKTPGATVKGADRLVRATRKAASPPRISKKQKRTQQRVAPGKAAPESVTEHYPRQVRVLIDILGDGVVRTDSEIMPFVVRHGLGDTERTLHRFYQSCRMVPWLRVERPPGAARFVVDTQLRDICDGLAPRPASLPIYPFLRHLREEIIRRRKENHERRHPKWNPTETSIVQQKQLLDWIEDELNTVPHDGFTIARHADPKQVHPLK